MFSVIAHASQEMSKDCYLSPFPPAFNFPNFFLSSSPFIETSSDFSKLFSVTNTSMDSTSDYYVLWDQHFCLKFHMLIIVTMIAYAHQLDKLTLEYHQNKGNKMNNCLIQVAYFAHLLTAIVESHAFLSYLKYLGWKGLLLQPMCKDLEMSIFWKEIMCILDIYK